MLDDFFCERLASLRTAKGVSARDMSLSIGQSANYINKIESKRSYPSMTTFLIFVNILASLRGVFFDDDNAYLAQMTSYSRT